MAGCSICWVPPWKQVRAVIQLQPDDTSCSLKVVKPTFNTYRLGEFDPLCCPSIGCSRGRNVLPDKLSPDFERSMSHLKELCKKRQFKEALDILDSLSQQDYRRCTDAYIIFLRRCTKIKDLEAGREVHAHIIKINFNTNVLLTNTLINMYAKCGCMMEARKLFEEMPEQNAFTWATMIAGYAQNADENEAVNLFMQMQAKGIPSDRITYISVLGASASTGSLARSKYLHASVLKDQVELDVFVGSSIVKMYCKCASLQDSYLAFIRMPLHNTVVWNAIIAGYISWSDNNGVMNLLVQMRKSGCDPDKVTYARILVAAANARSLEWGKAIHYQIKKSGIGSNVLIANALIRMYATCGSVEYACQVFDELHCKDVNSWTSMILAHVDGGDETKTITLLYEMRKHGFSPNDEVFLGLLSACAQARSLEWGKFIHTHILQARLHLHVVILNSLIHMYFKCGSILDALHTFGTMEVCNVSWNGLISGYVQNSNICESMKLLQWTKQYETPNHDMYINLFSACGTISDLQSAKYIHAHLLQSINYFNVSVVNTPVSSLTISSNQGSNVHGHFIGSAFTLDVILMNSLLNMYIKCGSIASACQVVNQMVELNIFTLTVVIAVHIKLRLYKEAFRLFAGMQHQGFKPDKIIITTILSACRTIGQRPWGKYIHSHVMQVGLEMDDFVSSSLIGMYGNCGSVFEMHVLFDSLPARSVVLWNVLISGYIKHGITYEALELFKQMRKHGPKANKITFLTICSACVSSGSIELGKWIHAHIVEVGMMSENLMGNILVDMYSKSGNMDEAFMVFNRMPDRDTVSWNTLMFGYAHNRYLKEAVEVFSQLQEHGLQPDDVTFVGLLSSCIGGLPCGKRFHSVVIKLGKELNVPVANALIGMYSKNCSFEDAHELLASMPTQDIISWTTMISGYADHGHNKLALKVFWHMQHNGLNPNKVSYVSSLSACANEGILGQGKFIHSQIQKHGLESDIFVRNALVSMYAKCGSMYDAYQLFSTMTRRDVVSWNVIISSCISEWNVNEAINFFWEMQWHGLRADNVTFVRVLIACARLGALECGRQICGHLIDDDLLSDITVGNSVIGMYSKCGSIEDARKAFDGMLKRDSVSWNAIISAYAEHGKTASVLKMFSKMLQQGSIPCAGTLISIIISCGHVGLVDEGQHFLLSLSSTYNMIPTNEHYSCAAYLLGRAGHLHEVKDLIENMPILPDPVLHLTFLAGCKIHANTELAEGAVLKALY